MPCYCDTPDEKDQFEIESRCKTSMYFEAQSLLTREQAHECEKKELKRFAMDNINDHLCKICHILTKEQMEQISAYYFQIQWKHNTLYDWYIQHCKDDIDFNKVLPEMKDES